MSLLSDHVSPVRSAEPGGPIMHIQITLFRDVPKIRREFLDKCNKKSFGHDCPVNRASCTYRNTNPTSDNADRNIELASEFKSCRLSVRSQRGENRDGGI